MTQLEMMVLVEMSFGRRNKPYEFSHAVRTGLLARESLWAKLTAVESSRGETGRTVLRGGAFELIDGVEGGSVDERR